MIWAHADYRSFLKAQHEVRRKKNVKFSSRAFARFLGMSPSALVEVISGKKNLSLSTSFQIGTRLELGPTEQEYFNLLVQLEASKLVEQKSQILERINNINPTIKAHRLNVDEFKLISEWYHFAILELVSTAQPGLTLTRIAKKLNLDRVQARAGIDRLLRLKLIKRADQATYARSINRVVVSSDIPNSALRSFHRQMITKAIESIDTQTPAEKIISSETFAFDPEQLGDLRKASDEYLDKVLSIARKGKKRTEVYHVGTQIFRVTDLGVSKVENVLKTGEKYEI